MPRFGVSPIQEGDDDEDGLFLVATLNLSNLLHKYTVISDMSREPLISFWFYPPEIFVKITTDVA